jgi:hypothetical protein
MKIIIRRIFCFGCAMTLCSLAQAAAAQIKPQVVLTAGPDAAVGGPDVVRLLSFNTRVEYDPPAWKRRRDAIARVLNEFWRAPPRPSPTWRPRQACTKVLPGSPRGAGQRGAMQPRLVSRRDRSRSTG